MIVLLTGPKPLARDLKATAFWLRRAYCRRFMDSELEYVISNIRTPTQSDIGWGVALAHHADADVLGAGQVLYLDRH